ncbi:MAG: hypothetical protein N2746_11500 [Deltaproteobacteria bacterium]|nr:hypothetical protein [Deltaproteobacteria bacterium]
MKFKIIETASEGYEIDEAFIYLYWDYPRHPNAAGGGWVERHFVQNNS